MRKAIMALVLILPVLTGCCSTRKCWCEARNKPAEPCSAQYAPTTGGCNTCN